jgi:hypothetical protein
MVAEDRARALDGDVVLPATRSDPDRGRGAARRPRGPTILLAPACLDAATVALARADAPTGAADAARRDHPRRKRQLRSPQTRSGWPDASGGAAVRTTTRSSSLGAWAHGSSAAGVVEVPAPSVAAIDSTGAGDAFNGALAVALAERRSLEEACRRAVAAGALATTRAGAREGMPGAAAFRAFLGEPEPEPRQAPDADPQPTADADPHPTPRPVRADRRCRRRRDARARPAQGRAGPTSRSRSSGGGRRPTPSTPRSPPTA